MNILESVERVGGNGGGRSSAVPVDFPAPAVWGDNGFAYASPAYITGAFFDESYGVTI